MHGCWQVLALGLLVGAPAGAKGREEGGPSERCCSIPAGTLDETFGAGGRVILDLGGLQDVIVAVAVQDDGRILAAGSSFSPAPRGNDFALVRFLPDGRLDPSFGAGGVVLTDLGDSDILGDMVLLRDGRFLVAGSSGGDQVVARYLPDGRLDPSFGAGGVVATDFSGDTDEAQAMALQHNGMIVVAGRSRAPGSDFDFSLARYLPDGRLDPSFGERGKVLLDFAGLEDEAAAIVIQPDQRIVVGGTAGTSTGGDFALARFDRRGRLDSSFGEDGRVRVDVAEGEDRLMGLALAPGHRLVAVGWAFTPETGWDFAIGRFDPRGRLDARFGLGGIVTVDFFPGGSGPEEDQAQAVAVQKDGRIVVAGRVFGAINPDFGLVRLTSTGRLDESFGASGRVSTDFSGGIDTANVVTLQPDGRILAAGFSRGETGDFALARYLGRCKGH